MAHSDARSAKTASVADGRSAGVAEPARRRRVVALDERRIDLAVMLLLFGAALLIRRLAVPTDGLLFDDAWVVAGSSKGSWRDLPAVSTNHPAFSLLLMGWSRTVSENTTFFAFVPLVVGSLLPAVTYGTLRLGRIGRAVSCGAAALLLTAPFHLMYSGRIKPYVIESLIGVILVAVLPRLAERTWNWRTAALWVMMAVLAGTFSGLTLILTAIAALALVAHPAGDLKIRAAALAAQGVVQAGYLRWVQSNFDAAQLAEDWETTYDSYIETDSGLWSIVRQVVAHTARLGQSLVWSGKTVGLLVALIAATGIAVAAIRSPHRVAARFLAGCWVVALLGGFVRQLPYGPKVGNPVFPGGRATLWLLPALLFGVAWAVQALVQLVADHHRPAVRPLIGAVVIGGLTVAFTGLPDGRTYIPMGTRTSVQAIGGLSDPTITLVLASSFTAVAAEPGVEVDIVADASSLTGFRLESAGGRFRQMPHGADLDAQLVAVIDGAEQVVVFNGFVGFGDGDLPTYEAALGRLGYRPAVSWSRSATAYQIWVKVR